MNKNIETEITFDDTIEWANNIEKKQSTLKKSNIMFYLIIYAIIIMILIITIIIILDSTKSFNENEVLDEMKR